MSESADGHLAKLLAEGDFARWRAAVPDLLERLASSIDQRLWPDAEATEVARYFLTVHVPGHAAELFTSGTREADAGSLIEVLARQLSSFATMLWDGRELSTAVIAGDQKAFELLLTIYSGTLGCYLCKDNRKLTTDEGRSEAINFLTEKLMVAGAAITESVEGLTDPIRKMLDRVARGERALRPRLVASISNWLLDERRKKKRKGPAQQFPVDADDAVLEPVDQRTLRSPFPLIGYRRTILWEDIRMWAKEHLKAVRQVPLHADKAKSAHRQALLLSARVNMLLIVAESHPDVDAGRLVTRAMPWNQEEENAVIGTRGMVLLQAWESLASRVERAETLKAQGIASTLGITVSAWSQWLHRGRDAMIKIIGPRLPAMLFRAGPGAASDPAADDRKQVDGGER